MQELSRIYNLSFDGLFDPGSVRGIENYRLGLTSTLSGFDVTVNILLSNDQESWDNQQRLADYYTSANKQTLEFNPRLSLCTGFLEVEYRDNLDTTTLLAATDELNSDIAMFSLIFSFAQRRRVIIGPMNLRN